MQRISALVILLSTATSLNSQSIGIGTNAPHPSAALEVAGTNKGFLPPRVTLTSTNDINTITNPAAGLLVYNTSTTGSSPNNVVPGYYYFDGQLWKQLSITGGAIGEMIFWNGSQWIAVPPGNYGQKLTFCNGVPTWGGCIPLVTTGTITNIQSSTASGGGNVSNDGGNPVTARGIVWSNAPNPTISLSTKTANGTDTGSFVSTLSPLSSNTTYYARAYATNSAGTTYGNEVSFKTKAYDIVTGLIAYYPFNGNTGDSSGNGYHGTANGTISYANDRNSNPASAVQLGSGYITANKTLFQFQYNQAFSISIWFTLETTASSGRLISTECPEGNFRISSYGNGQYAIQYGDATNYIYDNVPLNTWTHLVYTYNNREAKVYINGVLKYQTTNTATETLNFCSPFTIGAKASPSYDPWNGKEDDLRVYNRVLSADDIQYLYSH